MALMRDRLGIFSGFGDSRHEIVSQVLIPYQQSRMPLQGAFLVVGHDDLRGRPSGLLGRVTRAIPIGDLFSAAGEDYLVDLVRLGYEVPEEVKAGRLRYRISLRLLGQVTEAEGGGIEYTPAIRQMPHVGADVGFPSEEVSRFIARGCPETGTDPGPVIGHLSVGDLAFDGSDSVKGRTIPVHFRMDSLVGRRTAVFARAGMGKSNFTKVLLSRLYEAGGAGTPGTLVIDPEGEYAFANAGGPGLLDIPGLRDRLVVYTDRLDIEPRYARHVAGNCMVDFGDLDPVEIVASVLPGEKQETVFANVLRSLSPAKWKALVKYLARERYNARASDVAKITGKSPSGDVVMNALISNLIPPIERLHSARSTLIPSVQESLRRGRIVILDVSMLSAKDAKLIAGWALRGIFANNQEAYTIIRHRDGAEAARRSLIPCLAVFEEAQFYLGDSRMPEDSTFVRWFKEGRKFSLGSVLVTQQPGSIGTELISQCDNFFVFHLLSRVDLDALAAANLHYAGDIATSIGHEPIPGNCYFWSSRGLSFVTCARIIHFQRLAEEAEKRQHPIERIPHAVGEAGAGVALPVRPMRLGPGELRDYLGGIVRRLVESERSVHLFAVDFASEENGGEAPCVSAVADYLLRPIEMSLREDLRAGKAPREAANLLPLQAEEVGKFITESGLGPDPVHRPDARGVGHLLFFKRGLDLGAKPIRGSVRFPRAR